MRVALAQMNPRVGDFEGNLTKARHMVAHAREQAADVIVFPEFTLIGYPPKDLLLRREFIDASLQTLNEFAHGVTGIQAVVGYAEPNTGPFGKPLRNALAVIGEGRVQSRHYKQLLPTYDVFDEARYFEPTPPEGATNLTTIAGQRVGVTICEDIWCEPPAPGERSLYRHDPVAALVGQGMSWVVNISASPYGLGKGQSRPAMYSRQAKRLGRPVVVVNQVGGHEDLIFDGSSCAFDAAGNLIAHCREFAEDLVVVDLATGKGRIEHPAAGAESVFNALVFGIREYVAKRRVTAVAVPPDGTLGAAVVEKLAAHAVGRSNVTTATHGNDRVALACHNKTDLAFGNCTHVGDLAPIADLTRTRVRELAHWMNAHFATAISPTLIDDPTHINDRLDRVITGIIEEDRELRDIVGEDLDEASVRTLIAQIDAAEATRRRAAVGLKVTRRAFGPGRPMPAVR